MSSTSETCHQHLSSTKCITDISVANNQFRLEIFVWELSSVQILVDPVGQYEPLT